MSGTTAADAYKTRARVAKQMPLRSGRAVGLRQARCRRRAMCAAYWASFWQVAIDEDVYDSLVGIEQVAFAWDGDEDTLGYP